MTRFSFVSNGIKLDYQKVQTVNALSKLKANYHLFLRNQPRQQPNMARNYQAHKGWRPPKPLSV